MIGSLEGLRGLAAFMVALMHGWDSSLNSLPIIQNSWLFVDFFFVVSGFVMSHVYRASIRCNADLVSFMIKRLGRLYPLHLVTFVAYASVLWGLSGLTELLRAAGYSIGNGNLVLPPFDLHLFLPNLLLLHGLGFMPDLSGVLNINYPSWSISTEFWTYLLFALSVRFIPEKARTRLWVAVALAGGGLAWIAAKSLKPTIVTMDLTEDFGFIRCIYGFFVGAAIPLFGTKMKPSALGHLLGLTQFGLGLICLVFICSTSLFPTLTFVAPLIFALLVWSVSSDEGMLAGLCKLDMVQRLGTLSYSVYMNHATLLLLFGPVAARIGEPWLSILRVPYAAALLGLSTLTYRLIEVPWRNHFREKADSWSKAFKS